MKNLFLFLLSFTNQWTQIREMGGGIVKKFMERFFIYIEETTSASLVCCRCHFMLQSTVQCGEVGIHMECYLLHRDVVLTFNRKKQFL